MLRAFVIFNQIGFPMFTYIKKNGSIHPSALLDKADDMATKVSLSRQEFFTEDDEFYYYVALLPRKTKVVAIMDRDSSSVSTEVLKEVATKISEGDQNAIKDLIGPDGQF